MTDEKAAQTGEVSPEVTQAVAPMRTMLDLSSRPDSDFDEGSNGMLAWGSRSDVGLLRDHNEDSYLCRPPLFAVSDGMGGHAAGEVASSIAIHTVAHQAPSTADSTALGAAIEAANHDVIAAPETGRGRVGMGCTLTACIIDHDKMAVAHVGDSRLYLLHKGTLVRVTHDHSFVEELVDAGEITADEARTHPSRSVITRALGSDPDMYADHFTLDVEAGERIVLCSDGLSSMVPDAEIEDICVTSAGPQVCADALVSAALVAGGHDNVTVIVVDVLDDGTEAIRKKALRKAVITWASILAALAFVVVSIVAIIATNTYYLAPNGQTVGIYQGVFLGNDIDMSRLVKETSLEITELPDAFQNQIAHGVAVGSLDEATQAVDSLQKQVEEARAKAQETAEAVTGATDATNATDAAQTDEKPTDAAPIDVHVVTLDGAPIAEATTDEAAPEIVEPIETGATDVPTAPAGGEQA